jgi:hypothetical protein
MERLSKPGRLRSFREPFGTVGVLPGLVGETALEALQSVTDASMSKSSSSLDVSPSLCSWTGKLESAGTAVAASTGPLGTMVSQEHVKRHANNISARMVRTAAATWVRCRPRHWVI